MDKTSRIGLNLPDKGFRDWDVPINENFSLLDSEVAVLGLDNIFTGSNTFITSQIAKALNIDISSNPESIQDKIVTWGQDKNGVALGVEQFAHNTDGSLEHLIDVRRNINGVSTSSWISVGLETNGAKYARIAETPATNDSSNQIATTANVDAKITAQAVKLTGDQTISGTKIFTDIKVPTKNAGDSSEAAASTEFVKNVFESSGGGLEIGDIGFAPLGIDETQNKRRYLNGQVISQSQFVSFTNKIKSAVQLNPSLATSETNWQAEVTNTKLGQCGKFVIDDTLGTIRLPKVINIQGLQDLALMGSIKAERLPNITGSWGSSASRGGNVIFDVKTGAFSTEERTTTRYISSDTGTTTGDDGMLFTFDASRSSSTYQDNAPVQQEAVQYPYFIQVATGVEETVDVTREIELNNPFSLLDYKWSEYEITNASWLISNGTFHSGATYVAVYELLLKIYNGTETKDGVSVKLSTEAYEDTDFVINTADTTFRLPVKVKLASGNAVVGNGMTLGLTDGNNNYGGLGYSNANGVAIGQWSWYGTPVGTARGSAQDYNVDKSVGITTDPEKSGIETSSSGLKLYFYVGETIQDANVIAASSVLTEIANLKTHSIVETYVNGTSWYRIWSDGWCEQGGTTSTGAWTQVTFLKPYKDTNYTIIAGSTDPDRDSETCSCAINNKNETSFWIGNYYNGTAYTYSMWQACGYIN